MHNANVYEVLSKSQIFYIWTQIFYIWKPYFFCHIYDHLNILCLAHILFLWRPTSVTWQFQIFYI